MLLTFMLPSPIFCYKIALKWIHKRKQSIIWQQQKSCLFKCTGCIKISFTWELISCVNPFFLQVNEVTMWEKQILQDRCVFCDMASCGGQNSCYGFRPADLLLPAGSQWSRAGQQWPGHQLFSSCTTRTRQEGWPATWQDVRNRPLDVSKSRHS